MPEKFGAAGTNKFAVAAARLLAIRFLPPLEAPMRDAGRRQFATVGAGADEIVDDIHARTANRFASRLFPPPILRELVQCGLDALEELIREVPLGEVGHAAAVEVIRFKRAALAWVARERRSMQPPFMNLIQAPLPNPPFLLSILARMPAAGTLAAACAEATHPLALATFEVAMLDRRVATPEGFRRRFMGGETEGPGWWVMMQRRFDQAMTSNEALKRVWEADDMNGLWDDFDPIVSRFQRFPEFAIRVREMLFGLFVQDPVLLAVLHAEAVASGWIQEGQALDPEAAMRAYLRSLPFASGQD
ncbi:MAG: hypothetical protein JSR98_20020 [Proteobacteria bacterium]|nr:hypothetical protein [Pseudomonadota bacterium]